ncbi:hypothetical protein KFK09_026616 [Dendrobium nobile]|uniref:Uncharacterized protein n=1 Tax=Dendrobium nobile TaxID=94219 RepID=A0A8T3ADE3_DENNO|nr:hypothetical protein KFK09_026616 [Dendrobium nobile]
MRVIARPPFYVTKPSKATFSNLIFYWSYSNLFTYMLISYPISKALWPPPRLYPHKRCQSQPPCLKGSSFSPIGKVIPPLLQGNFCKAWRSGVPCTTRKRGRSERLRWSFHAPDTQERSKGRSTLQAREREEKIGRNSTVGWRRWANY